MILGVSLLKKYQIRRTGKFASRMVECEDTMRNRLLQTLYKKRLVETWERKGREKNIRITRKRREGTKKTRKWLRKRGMMKEKEGAKIERWEGKKTNEMK